MNDLERELRRHLEGDVRFDTYSRLLYSTDASMYQVEPIGVVIPRHAGDAQAVIEIANRHHVPLLPRGGGTSLTGQTVNRALVLDFTPHMAGVLEVNQDELWARVEPGLVQDELNHHVRADGLLFGPDTSTSNRATLGGMLGNNSGGSHSIAYGLTIDHVIELHVILADGSRAVFGEVTPAAFEAKTRAPGLEGQIYREVARVREHYRDEIALRFPKHWRRVCGYNLDELVKDRPLNMARLIVGSEGTFVTVVEAKVRLVRRPVKTAVDVIHYRDMQEALESSQAILATGPYAVELTDKMILDLARNNIEQSKRMGFVQGDPAVILIVEYAGESDHEVKSKVETLEALRGRGSFGYASHIAYDAGEQQSIWKLRKAGLGLLLGMKGESKPIAFVEDTAVDPARLPEFVPRFRDIMRKHGAEAAYYGHCSVGCLHIRPVIDLKTPRGLQQVEAMAGEIFDLVLEYGGAISSEHGDGRARSPFLERVYGPKIMQAFRELKAAFDPQNLMNPGNIVDSPGVTEHLRYGTQYRTWEPPTLLDFSGQGGFAAAVEMCNGVGVCRKKLEGTMCPSYMVTRDEEHTTRGRANALRAVLSGKVPAADFAGKRLYEVMDLCLECKGCKAECPSNVDMAKLKYEFLNHYHSVNGLPLRNRLFGRIARFSRLGSSLAPVSNWVAASWPNRLLMQWLAGIDRRRPLPPFARQTFTAWFDGRPARADAPRGQVVLFHDTFVTYNTPEIGQAAVELLEAAGYRVELADKKCCGRPLISKGMLAEAKSHAEWNVAQLGPWVARGVPIVGLEPSCLLTLRDEYVDLLRTEEARRVARSSFLLEEFLLVERRRGLSLPFANGGRPRRALLHGHCHQKALVGTAPTVAALTWAGFEVTEVDSGCCGMAGSFGFEREHYDISVALGNRRLAPAVKAAAPDTEVVAPGISCRQQIQHLTGRRAKHPAEVLRDSLGE
ncbi:MAG TPA: FAD-linked oxidase C-terminal domain-containing protein [Methylomirabilota bacterium]|jgi:FAD/FMN-containing dehydrogenase/Fe-S oxidoreductase|nr:FAD-linked oxidase C-terminal domain-containing protein [Methylomirabilota bacterium]